MEAKSSVMFSKLLPRIYLSSLRECHIWQIMTQSVQFSSFQLLSCVWLFATPWIAALQASLSITNSWSSLRLTSIEPWCHPAISSSIVLFSSCPQSLPASESFPMSQLFPWGGQNIRVWALASVTQKNTLDWLLRMDWLDLLAVQGTLKSLFQHHSSQASIPHRSAFFTVQLTSTHDHWKNHSLD